MSKLGRQILGKHYSGKHCCCYCSGKSEVAAKYAGFQAMRRFASLIASASCTEALTALQEFSVMEC
jgi:hypothetical protein